MKSVLAIYSLLTAAVQEDPENACILKGGYYVFDNAHQENKCVFNFHDAYKPCFSSSECEADCIVKNKQDPVYYCQPYQLPGVCWVSREEFLYGQQYQCDNI